MKIRLSDVYFVVLIITLFCGLVFYDFAGLAYTDECVGLVLLFMLFFHAFRHEKGIKKEFVWLVIIFLFYLFYSLKIHSNVTSAILIDFYTQLKPFLVFYCVWQLRPVFTKRQFRILRLLCLISAFLIPVLTILYWPEFLPGARLGSATTIIGFLYYYSSARKRKDFFIMLGIMLIGFIFPTAKFAGFVVITVTLFCLCRKHTLKLSLRTLLIGIVGSLLMGYVVWDDFHFYFVEGAEKGFERPLLYLASFFILNDYFPFGSGLASFATSTSANYYSQLYYDYGLSNAWGLSPEHPAFVSDTFYPELAQFGYVGVVLFFLFWYGIYKKVMRNYTATHDIDDYRLGVLIMIYFGVESIADSTFIQNRGVMMMMILAMIINHRNIENKNNRI